jgi:hypothetical protein
VIDMRETLAWAVLLAAFMKTILCLAVLTLASSAAAQTCDFTLCPSGWEYRPSEFSSNEGTCHHCNWFGYCSHSINQCPEGSTLDPKSGVCTWDLCGGGCGGELPLCDAPFRYTGSDVDAKGVYGVCTVGPHFPTWAIAHELRRCRDDFELDTKRGVCVKRCELADLVLAKPFFLDAKGSVVASVQAGQPYSLCVQVQNIGRGDAGVFKVAGGGLAVPFNPTVAVASLAAGAVTNVCLEYPSTPPPGSYRVGVSADSTGLVTESDEANNELIVDVTVAP